MGAATNEKTARSAVEYFVGGNIESLLGLMAPDLVWRAPGHNPVAGTYGRDNVIQFFGGLKELSGGTVHVTLDDLLVSDERFVWFLRMTADRAGKHLDVLIANPVTTTDEGRIRESWFLPSDQKAWDEFWN